MLTQAELARILIRVTCLQSPFAAREGQKALSICGCCCCCWGGNEGLRLARAGENVLASLSSEWVGWDQEEAAATNTCENRTWSGAGCGEQKASVSTQASGDSVIVHGYTGNCAFAGP